MKVSESIYDIAKIICSAIKRRQLLYFPYDSETSGLKPRKIRPYMIIPNERDKLKVVGLPTEELKIKRLEERKKGHYLLDKLDITQLEILDEIFDDPGVPKRIVVVTQSQPVCRFIYDEENEKAVKKSWIKIEVDKTTKGKNKKAFQ